MKLRERSIGALLLPLAVAAVLLAAAAAALGASRPGGGQDRSAAIEYLRTMETGDPDQVAAVIREQSRARAAAEREELLRQLAEGELDLWSQFRDAVLLGDSRVYGFSYNGLLPQERVLADVGDTVMDLEAHIPDIAALYPARVYVSYGINEFDMSGRWPTGEDFVSELASVLKEVEAAVPGVEIYVNSMIEVREGGRYKGGRWEEFPHWNELLRQMCAEEGYAFVDNTQIAEEHADLYVSDGVHFETAFYDYWAANMILAAYEREEGAVSE